MSLPNCTASLKFFIFSDSTKEGCPFFVRSSFFAVEVNHFLALYSLERMLDETKKALLLYQFTF